MVIMQRIRCILFAVFAVAVSAAPARAQAGACAGTSSSCVEVANYVARVTDFRTSAVSYYKLVTVTVNFQNKTNRPLILGYVGGSGVVTDDQGNRYLLEGANALRGIGQIAGNSFDPKFALMANEKSDARFEFIFRPGRQVLGTRFDIDLAIREIDAVAGNQFRLGRESALHFSGFGGTTPVAAGPSPVVSGTPAPATPAPAHPAAEPVAPVADPCGGKSGCASAGPFKAELTRVTTSKVTYYQLVKTTIKVTNLTNQPVILAYTAGSGLVTDDQGNRYPVLTAQGIGLVTGSAADPQFVLNPGESRNATFESRLRVGRAILGTKYTSDLTFQQLEILPSRQVRSVREYAISFKDFSASP